MDDITEGGDVGIEVDAMKRHRDGLLDLGWAS